MAIFGVLLLLESSMSRRERAFLILIMAFVYFGIAHDQKTKLGNDNYEIISTARPLAVAVIEANKTGGFSERDRVLIDTINKVVDVNLITSTKQDGVGLYWTGKLVRHGYTHQQYKDYLKAFFVLSTRYPKVVLRERLNTLDRSISFFKRSNVQNVLGARTLLPDNNAKKRYFAANYILAKPVLAKERMRFIDTFNIGQCKRWYQKLIYTIFWSPAPEIVLFIGLFVFFLARKMWFDGFLISGLLIRFVLVFLTSPADWYMYFHSYLFLGQFLFIMWFCKWYKERQLQRKHI